MYIYTYTSTYKHISLASPPSSPLHPPLLSFLHTGCRADARCKHLSVAHGCGGVECASWRCFYAQCRKGVLQCVAVCCSVLQCVAVCYGLLQCVMVCCSVLQCVAFSSAYRGGASMHNAEKVCCSVLQCVAVCCSVLQCVAVCCSVLQCAAVCCSVLQCVAVCCSVLQCVAVCCSVLQCACRRMTCIHKHTCT